LVTGILISLAYGIIPKAENDPLINLAEETMRMSATGAIPGKFLVDVLPMVEVCPGMGPWC